MAYAAITCLMSTIDQSMQLYELSLQSSEHSLQLSNHCLQSFYEKIGSLRDILEKSKKSTCYHDKALISLEAQIAELAYTAGSTTDSLGRNVISEKTASTRNRSFLKLCCYLDQAVEGIDSTMKQWLETLDRHNNINALKIQNLALVSTPGPSVQPESVMVGHEDGLDKMLDRLTRGARELEVVSIVGMGGIGKTTFANKLYMDPSVMSRFDIRAKVTLSQEYRLRNVLLVLLSSIGGKSDEFDEESDGELGDRLQKLLKGRRYLVLIDDIWTGGAWDDIKLCFPDCGCSSRILLTTRNMNVAEYASSGMPPYKMRLLNFDESWSLLKKKVFLNDWFSPEFEQLGKEIASTCGGLPLPIVVISGLLSKIRKALDEWKSVVQSVTSSVSTDLEGQCMRVVGLSYRHLPDHLKACFQYFAIFSEDKLVFSSKITKIWSAEGFLKVEDMKSLEEVAEQCLKELIDRNLIFMDHLSFDGKIKSCGMHDVIRELCLTEARSTHSINVIKENQNRLKRSSFINMGGLSIMSEHTTFVDFQLGRRSYNECYSIIHLTRDLTSSSIMPQLLPFKILRVLDLTSVRLKDFPKCTVMLFRLRYLSLCFEASSYIYIPPSIANLLYLQILLLKFSIQSSAFSLPSEIFKMSQLRHLSLRKSYLVQRHESRDIRWIMRNLQSLCGWDPLFCTSSILELFPNVKKLEICSNNAREKMEQMKGLHYLCCLDKLEELKFRGVRHLMLPPPGAFPKNLMKLGFSHTFMNWDNLRIVGKLPKLEALKLGPYACNGRKWEVVEEGFPRLKFLQLKRLSIGDWKATSDQFPCLERLFLRSCWYLDSIPQDFEEVTTLELIHVENCRDSLKKSAKKIQKEIKDNYGTTLEVQMM